jgi:hypothetical protein
LRLFCGSGIIFSKRLEKLPIDTVKLFHHSLNARRKKSFSSWGGTTLRVCIPGRSGVEGGLKFDINKNTVASLLMICLLTTESRLLRITHKTRAPIQDQIILSSPSLARSPSRSNRYPTSCCTPPPAQTPLCILWFPSFSSSRQEFLSPMCCTFSCGPG